MCNAVNGDKVVSNRAPYCSVQQGIMAPFVAKLALILSVVFFAAGENGEPDYPDVVSIFGTNSSENYTVSVAECFGQYSKMQGVSSNGRPVWKHNSRDERYLFL